MNMKNYFAVIVIFLFVGVSVAPSINANVSKENLVEFTTEVCGLDSIKQTVKLTQQEAEEVEELFDSIRKKLNATESREKAEEIFKEAVVELDMYGLLSGLSIEQAQRLVTGGYQNSRLTKIFNRLFKDSRILGNKSNFLCLIVGDTGQYTRFQGPIFRSYISLLMIIAAFMYLSSLYDLAMFILEIVVLSLLIITSLTAVIDVFNIFPIANVIGIGNNWGFDTFAGNNPAVGWINSIGLNGVKNWNGPLYGNLPIIPIIYPLDFYYSGIFGFTGLRINYYNYIGSALWVKIGHKPPQLI